MKKTTVLVFGFLLCLILISSCGGEVSSGPSPTPAPSPTPDPCGPREITRYLDSIEDVQRRFDDAFVLANNTPRGSLSPVIGDLQEIRRDPEDLDIPECTLRAKNSLVDYMDAGIEGFLFFLSSESDSKVNRQFELTSALLSQYFIQLEILMEGSE